MLIRKADFNGLSRIAEIQVFTYRLYLLKLDSTVRPC